VRRQGRQLELVVRTWGGRREGAGRKPGPGRRHVPHRRRERHDPRCPAHVTLRAAAGLPSLRGAQVFPAVRDALAAASGERFRVLQFSVQKDHVHLLLESDTIVGFRRGVQGLAIRIARAVNRVLGRRGRVWGDRYHTRRLKTPREVRNALVYVLTNWRKHVPGARGIDPRSSGVWFEGWRERMRATQEKSPVAAPRTWLARLGWRKHGLLGLQEAPHAG
jgi:REP element-mobilizing transposase RayT